MKTFALVSSCKKQPIKDPGGLRTPIQYIFAMYLQTGLLGTLDILRFLSTAYERRVWSNTGKKDSTDQPIYFQLHRSKALPRQFTATVCSGCCQKWLGKTSEFCKVPKYEQLMEQSRSGSMVQVSPSYSCYQQIPN